MRDQETAVMTDITWEDLLRMLEERPEWLERVRQVVLTRELLALPEVVRELAEAQRGSEERLSRLEATVQELAEAQRETTRQIQELRQGLEEVSRQVYELTRAISRLTETVTRLDGTVGDIKGQLLEMAYRDKPYAYFGRILRSIRIVSFTEIEDSLENRLSREEIDDLLQLDLLLRGRLRDHPERPEVWLAVEVSSVVDKWDVERAKKRAALLGKAGLRAVPVAAGLQILPEAAHKAEIDGVTVITDGSIADWDQALRSVLA